MLGALVVVGALLSTAIGAVTLFAPTCFLALVGQPDQELGSAAIIFAEYAGARELAIGAALLTMLAARSARLLAGIVVIAALANATDAFMAIGAQRWPQLLGAVMFALVYAVYAYVVTWRHARTNG